MKKIIAVLFLAVVLATCCMAEDFDGYIVSIKDDAAESLSLISMFSDNAYLFDDMDASDTAQLLADEFEYVDEINYDHKLLKVSDESVLDELLALGVVDNYEENNYLELYGYDYTLNPNYSDQSWYLDYINADFTLDSGIYGKDVKVAVIDSGVYPHKDIKDNLLPGECYLSNFDVSDTFDYHEHGTPIAGLIAAQCNNLATVGISFMTKIVPLKVTNSHELSLEYAISAIYDAVDYYECDVLNLSFGTTKYSQNLEIAVNYAISKGKIVVAAAGNGGDTGYAYPAAFDSVVSVASAGRVGSSLRVADSSQKNDRVDITAPGVEVHSLAATDSGVKAFKGTSFSCPMVSAVAALAKSVNPNITQSEFERMIKLTADSSYLKTSGQDKTCWGEGLLDIEAFFKLMLAGEDCYLSEVYTKDGDSFVLLKNLSDEKSLENCSVIFDEYDAGGFLAKSSSVTVDLSASEIKEISLTSLGVSLNSIVRCVSSHIPGDINGDKKVNILDVSALLKHLADYEDSVVESALDVNGDGNVTISDASVILKFIAGYPSEMH